jgi:hypothetical protein
MVVAMMLEATMTVAVKAAVKAAVKVVRVAGDR